MKKKVYQPQPEHSAKIMGSGGLEVLATPALVAFMENLAFEALQEQLSPEESSVGTQLIIDHLAPSLTSQAIHIQITEWQTENCANTLSIPKPMLVDASSPPPSIVASW
ncbi:thioesterase family protein [Streptococcus sp.]|uniref:thioesterase family protein n=1 Tax=Streptococcus sp. TaxID=1306 RepID=UPI00391C7BE5